MKLASDIPRKLMSGVIKQRSTGGQMTMSRRQHFMLSYL
jgi:hypothetical protein